MHAEYQWLLPSLIGMKMLSQSLRPCAPYQKCSELIQLHVEKPHHSLWFYGTNSQIYPPLL
jgi:hypothetical protein